MPATAGTSPEDRTRETAVEPPAPAFERVGVALAATSVPSLLLVHGLAALLHTKPGISPGAVGVSWAVLAVASVNAIVQWRWPGLPAWSRVVAPVAAALALASTAGVAGALSVAVCGAMQGWAQSRVARALPAAIDGRFGARPWRAVGWSLLALLAVVQTARIASHEADPEVPWWVTTEDPAWAGHICSSAYVHAAGLHDQGQTNIYDESHYPPSDDAPRPTVANLERHVECGFQYPPPFLLLPWTALRFTNDFYVIRPVWLALQGLGFLAVAVSLCLWVGGSRGRLALWLLPAVWVAVPTLQTFQFGQFHPSAFALAVAGMVAFEARRNALGGALLGAAVVTKLYPGVLILLLASQRRWRQLAVTLIWMVGFALLGLVLLGPAPYQAFVSQHVPRMLDGSAFPSPNGDDMMTAILTGITALPGRLRIIGLTSVPTQLGPWLGHALGLGILALVWVAGRRTTSRAQAVMLWLALLNLVVLQGPAAFSDYTPATSLWLLTFVSVEMARNRVLAIGLWIAWLHLATLLGTFPMPGEPSEALIAASTVLMTLFMLALNLWCAMRTDGRDEPVLAGPELVEAQRSAR